MIVARHDALQERDEKVLIPCAERRDRQGMGLVGGVLHRRVERPALRRDATDLRPAIRQGGRSADQPAGREPLQRSGRGRPVECDRVGQRRLVGLAALP